MQIKELTKKQEAMMPTWRDKWIDVGLRTGETDWETFEKYIPVCYEKAKLSPPKRIIRVQSPIVGALAASIANSNSAVASAVRSAVGSAVRSAVDSAVGSAVRSAVDSAVGSAVRSAVDSAVDSAVGSAVRSAVRSAVDSAVRSAVYSAVYSAVDSAVRSAVYSAVYSAVDSAVRSAVYSAVGDAKLEWHYWFGGQFWVGGWSGSPSFVSFFTDICGLKLNRDIQERATAYQKICESVNYFWCYDKWVMVCARPTRISRNAQGQLHYEHGKAILYPDGWGIYALNGVIFPEELYLKIISREMEFGDILKIEDIDQRVQAMKFAKNGLREFYKKEGGEMIDHYVKLDIKGRPVNYELWAVPKGKTFTQDVKFAIYNCPSAQEMGQQREYSKGVPVECKTIAESMAWGMSSDGVKITAGEWQKLVPLREES